MTQRTQRFRERQMSDEPRRTVSGGLGVARASGLFSEPTGKMPVLLRMADPWERSFSGGLTPCPRCRSSVSSVACLEWLRVP
jgi:hypothetical protein